MGYLTTITIYNDRLHEIKEDPEKFVEDITKYIAKGGMARFDYALAETKIQKPRHADDHTIYVHLGNTVIDVNPYTREMEAIRIEFPELYDMIIGELELMLELLKEKKKK